MLLSEDKDGAVDVWIQHNGTVGRWSLDGVQENSGEAEAEQCFAMAGNENSIPSAIAQYGDWLYSLHQNGSEACLLRWNIETGGQDMDWKEPVDVVWTDISDPRLIVSNHTLYLVDGDSLPHGDGSTASAPDISGEGGCLKWEQGRPIGNAFLPRHPRFISSVTQSRSPPASRSSGNDSESEPGIWAGIAAIAPAACVACATGCGVYKCYQKRQKKVMERDRRERAAEAMEMRVREREAASHPYIFPGDEGFPSAPPRLLDRTMSAGYRPAEYVTPPNEKASAEPGPARAQPDQPWLVNPWRLSSADEAERKSDSYGSYVLPDKKSLSSGEGLPPPGSDSGQRRPSPRLVSAGD